MPSPQGQGVYTQKTGDRRLCRRRIYMGYNPFGICRVEAGRSHFKRQVNKTSLSHNMVEQHFCPRSHQNMGPSSDFVKIGLWSVIRCGRVGRGCSDRSKNESVLAATPQTRQADPRPDIVSSLCTGPTPFSCFSKRSGQLAIFLTLLYHGIVAMSIVFSKKVQKF